MSTVVINRESCHTSLPEFFRRNSGQSNSSQEKTVKTKPKPKPNLKKSISSPVSASSLSWEANSIKNVAESSKTSLLTNGNKLTLPVTPTETQSTWTTTKRLISTNCNLISSAFDVSKYQQGESLRTERRGHALGSFSHISFSDISADEYEAISKLVFETEHIYPKPRLTFISDRSLLIAKMALPLHEVGVTFLASELSLIGGVPFDKRLVTVIVDTNRRRNTPNSRSVYMLDFSVSFKVMRKLDGECALSQDEDVLHEKFKFEVASNTEVDLVVKLKVDEGDDYESPEPTSDAYKLLVAPKFNQDSKTLVPSAESHLPLDEFTFLMDTSAPSTSVVVAGHTWCNINAAHFQIWVRGNTPIDVNVDDGPDVAHGTLFPEIDMDNVNNMMRRGLARMRDHLADLLQALDPQSDVSLIRQHDPLFPINLDWDHCRDNFLIAAEETAHAWYIEWYHAKLAKRVHSLSDRDSDSNYIDSGTSQGDDDSHDDGPCCNTRARKKQKIDGEFVNI
ncbi:hypothetical protein EV702DRAFT_1200311 [Suillus placidus]|uniref:Uncharacterized protein n=1 Tax=Suillus placidus TaxID=48579 RepID=A0A9P6ZQ77_9AGAM|nr:hypothetical protein EV702DRAFT_1200311 [Suillus placidus]